MPDTADVTQCLMDWRAGNRAALEKLIPMVEHTLRNIAQRQMRGEHAGHTLQATALVNEAYIGDDGAHCGTICDGSFPTFMLSYWVGDRTRGERLSLSETVRMLSRDAARAIGLEDRGVIAPGYKADLNVIDLDQLRLYAPEVVHDLPTGGRRLVQSADGYCATIVGGRIVHRNGSDTGELPGRLVRGPQAAPPNMH